MRATCPSCGRSGRVPDTVTHRKSIRCPACETLFNFDPSPGYELVPAEKPPVPLAAVESVPGIPGLVITVDESPRPATVSVVTPAQRKGNALAIASLVVGIIAASVCWVPFLGLVARPLAILGCILGLPGVALSLSRNRSGFPAAAMGLALSVGSSVYALYISSRAAEAIHQAFKTPPPAVAQPAKADHGDPAEWVQSPAPATLGSMTVRVASARISTIQLKGIGGDSFDSSERYLVLVIEVANESATKKASYRSWGERDLVPLGDGVTLTDNFGNTYHSVGSGFTSEVVGRVKSASLYPRKSTSDLLVFEVPVDGVHRLDLTLPASHVGESGVYRFRIGAASIER